MTKQSKENHHKQLISILQNANASVNLLAQAMYSLDMYHEENASKYISLSCPKSKYIKAKELYKVWRKNVDLLMD